MGGPNWATSVASKKTNGDMPYEHAPVSMTSQPVVTSSIHTQSQQGETELTNLSNEYQYLPIDVECMEENSGKQRVPQTELSGGSDVRLQGGEHELG